MKRVHLLKLIGMICAVLVIGLGGIFAYQSFTTSSKTTSNNEQNNKQTPNIKKQDPPSSSKQNKQNNSKKEEVQQKKRTSDKTDSSIPTNTTITNLSEKSVDLAIPGTVKRAPVQYPTKQGTINKKQTQPKFKPKNNSPKLNPSIVKKDDIKKEDTQKQDTNDNSYAIQNALFTIYNYSSIEYSGFNEAKIGSGFLYSLDNKNGYIMTNAHVVEGANRVEIITNDTNIAMSNSKNKKKSYTGYVIGFSTNPDIALIYVPEFKSGFYPINSSYKAKIGDEVTSYSSGHESDSTDGKIKNKYKNEEIKPFGYPELYEMSASVLPGFSGGPVVLNKSKEIIAINAAINTITSDGYSIPIHSVKNLADGWIKDRNTKTQKQIDLEIKKKFPTWESYQEDTERISDSKKDRKPKTAEKNITEEETEPKDLKVKSIPDSNVVLNENKQPKTNKAQTETTLSKQDEKSTNPTLNTNDEFKEAKENVNSTLEAASTKKLDTPINESNQNINEVDLEENVKVISKEKTIKNNQTDLQKGLEIKLEMPIKEVDDSETNLDDDDTEI